MTTAPGPGPSAGSAMAPSLCPPPLQPELQRAPQRQVNPGSDLRLPCLPEALRHWRGAGRFQMAGFVSENRGGPERTGPRTSSGDREWHSRLLYAGFEQVERLQIVQWLGEGTGAEGDDRLIPSPDEVIEIQTEPAPKDRIIFDSQCLDGAFLEHLLGPLRLHSGSQKGCGKKEVEKPEHQPMRAIGFIAEPVLGPERVMQAGRGFEGHPRANACDHESDDIARTGKGFPGYAARAYLGPAS